MFSVMFSTFEGVRTYYEVNYNNRDASLSKLARRRVVTNSSAAQLWTNAHRNVFLLIRC